MDNITANKTPWFQDDKEIKEKEKIEETNIQEVKPVVNFPDLSNLKSMITMLDEYYAYKADKQVGDLIIALEGANKKYIEIAKDKVLPVNVN